MFSLKSTYNSEAFIHYNDFNKLKVRKHVASNPGDMSQWHAPSEKIPPCALNKNFVSGTKFCPRHFLHEFKLIWILASSCKYRNVSVRHVPSRVNSLCNKFHRWSASTANHRASFNSQQYFNSTPLPPMDNHQLKLVNQVEQVSATSFLQCLTKGTRTLRFVSATSRYVCPNI